MPALPVACSTRPIQVSAPAKPSSSSLKALPALPRAKSAMVAGAAAALLVASAPQALAADLALGAEVFNNNCAACHMSGLNSVIPERTLQKAAIEQYLAGGFNVDAIITQVENGKGAMPAWEGRLSEEEIQAVAAYVFKQADGNLW